MLENLIIFIPFFEYIIYNTAFERFRRKVIFVSKFEQIKMTTNFIQSTVLYNT